MGKRHPSFVFHMASKWDLGEKISALGKIKESPEHEAEEAEEPEIPEPAKFIPLSGILFLDLKRDALPTSFADSKAILRSEEYAMHQERYGLPIIQIPTPHRAFDEREMDQEPNTNVLTTESDTALDLSGATEDTDL